PKHSGNFLSRNPGPARIFDEAMASRSAAEISAMLGVYDFSQARRIVDVGGGNGALLAAIVNTCPHLDAVLFDRPSVIERAPILSDRISFASGDFFGEIPSRGDIYLLKKVIHDWPDDRAQAILQRCRQAMSLQARLLL